MDEIDFEEGRLDFLRTQGDERISGVVDDNAGLNYKEVHEQTTPKVIGTSIFKKLFG